MPWMLCQWMLFWSRYKICKMIPPSASLQGSQIKPIVPRATNFVGGKEEFAKICITRTQVVLCDTSSVLQPNDCWEMKGKNKRTTWLLLLQGSKQLLVLQFNHFECFHLPLNGIFLSHPHDRAKMWPPWKLNHLYQKLEIKIWNDLFQPKLEKVGTF